MDVLIKFIVVIIHNVYVYQIIIMYTLSMYYFICQIYLQ